MNVGKFHILVSYLTILSTSVNQITKFLIIFDGLSSRSDNCNRTEMKLLTNVFFTEFSLIRWIKIQQHGVPFFDKNRCNTIASKNLKLSLKLMCVKKDRRLCRTEIEKVFLPCNKVLGKSSVCSKLLNLMHWTRHTFLKVSPKKLDKSAKFEIWLIRYYLP